MAVDDSATVRETLAVLIEAQPDMELVGSAASGQEAVRRAAEWQPDIVLMDIHMPDLDGIQATWLVSSRAPHGAVIMVTSEERIDFLQKAMSAGAQGYVLKPFGNGAQLFQTIRDVHGRSSARRMQASSGGTLDDTFRPRIGKRIAVLGPKGGVGATTIAVNVALALQESGGGSTALFDGDFLGGDATLHLDVQPNRTVLDLVPHTHALDARLLDQVMVKHRTGLQVLARPLLPEQAEVVTADHIRTILGSLAQMFDHVVIDGALTYDDRMLAMLDLADLYVVAVTAHLGTLRSARHFLNIAQTLGYPDDRMLFVLNRATTTAGLAPGDISGILGFRTIHTIPTGGPELTQSINDGRPPILNNAKSPVARALASLAAEVRSRTTERIVRAR
ncbi:MAG: AAA family ATPase [Chloroflexota bacterium]